jgi:hypothetical protein
VSSIYRAIQASTTRRTIPDSVLGAAICKFRVSLLAS